MKNVGTHLESLKTRLTLNWGELAERLEISRAMLDFIRSGVRRPSAKLARRIMEVERDAGINTHNEPSTISASMCAEIDDRLAQVETNIRTMTEQLAAIRKAVENAGYKPPKQKEEG